MKCEWCGKNYPEELESGVVFYTIMVYGTDYHCICAECHHHLKSVQSFSTNKNDSMKKVEV
jgi:hypothetical protein